MTQNFFHLLNHAFKLMAENKLRKDIDDTLLEKLLTLLKKFKLKGSKEIFTDTQENHGSQSFNLVEELSRTEVLHVIEEVLSSTSERNDNYPIIIKSFVIRLLGLILTSPQKCYSYDSLLPLLKCTDENRIDHPPSIQDSLLDCLSSVTKEIEGVIWFIDQNVINFVFSSFNSSSYYVRKSSVDFVVSFISQWIDFKLSDFKLRELEENYVEDVLKNVISYIIHHISLYKNSQEIVFAQCCVSIMEQLLLLQNIEKLIGDHLEFSRNISDCFTNLSEDSEFNIKLADLFLAIHFKFELCTQAMNNAIKCLIIKEDMKVAFHLASSFVSIANPEDCSREELMFFLFPLHILKNTKPETEGDICFGVKADLVYNIIFKKMKDKSDCKTLVSSSLSSLQKLIPETDYSNQTDIGRELLHLVMYSDEVKHDWYNAVLDDRFIHHAFTELYASCLSEDAFHAMNFGGYDVLFHSILEFLQKPTTDSNFMSKLLLLMRDVLVLHEKYKLSFEGEERLVLIQVLCEKLHVTVESIVDSALHLAKQMIIDEAFHSYIVDEGLLTIVWDIAIQGNHDGTIRSTALKAIIEGCLQAWCLREMETLRGMTKTDIPKILFDLTFNPDFFLQREAMSCLFMWVKSEWRFLELSSKEYLFSALVTAIQSLDLEQKLISLDVWLWLLEEKCTFATISPSFDAETYIEYLASSGFGLSMILALEDYDPAVQFKAADILSKLQTVFTSRGISFDSLTVSTSTCDINGSQNCNSSEYLAEPVTKEEKDKGIDTVMEISTTDQITKLCRPPGTERYDFRKEYFPINKEEMKCSFFSFWTCLWSENITSILQPSETTEDIDTSGESLLRDIISASIVEYDSVEDTPDCY